jgi:hypothetical protein
MKVWTVTAVLVATVFYVLALTDEVYLLTSPPALGWHVLLRKVYSIVAFALAAYLTGRAASEWGLKPSVAGLALAVAFYSAAIEVGQALHGSEEGLLWNAVDVACGGLGGYFGALGLRLKLRPVRARPPR